MEENTGIDILQVEKDVMKDVMIQEIKKISDKDAVEFGTVWTKEPESDKFQKTICIEIIKGVCENDKK